MTPPPLTAELIARVHPAPCPDEGPVTPTMDDAALEASRRGMLGGLDPAADIWLFGYGSLMWNPDLDFAERRPGRVHGWHRRFCLRQWRFRGRPDAPGLVLALDRGGSCVGVLFRVPGPGAADRLAGTWRREMRGRGYRPAWMRVASPEGRVRALGFVADRLGPRYAGDLDDAAAAALIARACGHVGPSATYLFETWRHCREIGIRDPMLERLARLTARELAVLAPPPSDPPASP